MTFFKILFSGLLLLILGGFGYVALSDTPIHQEDVVKTLPASNFIK
ncbi:MAG: hypothetical protein R3D88_01150 [Alphaproteobacteria bacterium]|nr:hypothetical protein [Alphaproteobacteria bacterium]